VQEEGVERSNQYIYFLGSRCMSWSFCSSFGAKWYRNGWINCLYWFNNVGSISVLHREINLRYTRTIQLPSNKSFTSFNKYQQRIWITLCTATLNYDLNLWNSDLDRDSSFFVDCCRLFLAHYLHQQPFHEIRVTLTKNRS